MASNDVSDILDRVRTLLDESNAQEAMALVSPHTCSGSKAIVNAYAVCLMRLGRLEEAVKVLRELVYRGSSFAVAADVPLTVKTNFATALLLTRNVDGARNILDQLRDDEGECVTRLKSAILNWRKSLTLAQSLQCLWGTPDKPVTLEFPPGDL